MNTIQSATEALTTVLMPTSPLDVAQAFIASATTNEAEIEVARLLVELKNMTERYDYSQDAKNKLHTHIHAMRDAVRNAFVNEIESSSDTATLDLEEANALLEVIGAKKLLFTWTTTVTSTVVITGIEASSYIEAERLAYDAVSISTDLDNCGDEAAVENEEQETSDTKHDD